MRRVFLISAVALPPTVIACTGLLAPGAPTPADVETTDASTTTVSTVYATTSQSTPSSSMTVHAMTSQSAFSSSSTTSSTGMAVTSTNGGDGGVCYPRTPQAIIYNGGISDPVCLNSIQFGIDNDWFSYNDTSVDGGTILFGPVSGGCDTPCAFNATGMNGGYGAGIGFTLNDNNPYNAGQYNGVEACFKGTTAGTRGPQLEPENNVVHVKFITSETDPAGSAICTTCTGPGYTNNDAFGAYVPLDTDGGWGCYAIPFNALQLDEASDIADAGPFDPTELIKIEFEFSNYYLPPTTADGSSSPNPAGVTFNVSFSEVAFF